MRVAMYLRVSTNEQSTDMQREALQAAMRQRGWEIVETYEDAGISGARGRDKRPAFDKLHKDATRGRFDIVAAWSVDRLGRSLPDLISFLAEMQAASVGLYLHQQAIDTTTPAGRALFGMLGVFAEFERAILCSRVREGIAKARAQGKRLGRAPVSSAAVEQVKANPSLSHRALARLTGLAESTVRKVRKSLA